METRAALSLRIPSAATPCAMLGPLPRPVGLAQRHLFGERMRALLGPGRAWRPTDDCGGVVKHILTLEPPAARSLGVARPCSTAEVAAVIGLCSEFGVPVVPNCGLGGDSTHIDRGDAGPGIGLSLARMNCIEAIDPINFTVTVEAGVTLEALTEALSGEGLALPASIDADRGAQIGTLIGVDAGDQRARMHDIVLTLDVVLPDGKRWEGVDAPAGADSTDHLRHLFCGAHGALGIVTRAVLRVAPAPVCRAAVLVAVDDLAAAVKIAVLLRIWANDFLRSIDFFCEDSLASVLAATPARVRPLTTTSHIYLLAELASSLEDAPLAGLLDKVLAFAETDGAILDAAVALDDPQIADWRQLLELMSKPDDAAGVGSLARTIMVPLAELPACMNAIRAAVNGVLPGVRVHGFGQLDGAVRVRLLPPSGQHDFAGRDRLLAGALDCAARVGKGRLIGSDDAAADGATTIDRSLMRQIKATLDPKNILQSAQVR